MTASTKISGPRPSDKWIPWYFVAFFVALISVLAPMAYFAVHTLPGTVTDNAYEKGLAYNKAIAAGEQQAALGWRGDVTIEPTGVSGEAHARYTLRDAQSKAITDAQVSLWLVRPTIDKMDQKVDLVSDGDAYAATVKMPASGVWDAQVSATKDGKNYQISKRVVLP